MSYKADFLSLTAIAVNLLLFAIGLSLPIGYGSIIYVLLGSTLVFMVYHVNHNHMHQAIFQNDKANYIVNSLMSLAILNPVTLFYYPHLSNHHPNYCNDQDWTGTHHAGNRMGLIRVFRYNISVFLHFFKNGYFISRSKLPTTRKISLGWELLTLATFVAVALTYVPLSTFLVHVFLPAFLGLQGMIFMNFFVHDGCEPDVRAKSCRNFTSFRANFLTFNNGYHLAHHETPHLHWSLLPATHQEKYTPKLDKKFIHDSSSKHFVRHYVIGRPFEL